MVVQGEDADAVQGYSGLVVYADDFVACFQYKEKDELFYEVLKKRLEHFSLKIEEDKIRLIEFGRFAEESRRKRGERKPKHSNSLDLPTTARE